MKMPKKLKVGLLKLTTIEYCVTLDNQIIGRFSNKSEAIKMRAFYEGQISKFSLSQIAKF